MPLHGELAHVFVNQEPSSPSNMVGWVSAVLILPGIAIGAGIKLAAHSPEPPVTEPSQAARPFLEVGAHLAVVLLPEPPQHTAIRSIRAC